MANKKNNFMKLPHINTLRKYTNFTKPTSDFNKDVIERLIEDSRLEHLDDLQKNVLIMFDEMKVKCDLIYSKATGKLVGFTDMGISMKKFENFKRIKKRVTYGKRICQVR